MRIFGVIGTAVLFLLLVTTAPVFAQDEAKPDESQNDIADTRSPIGPCDHASASRPI